MGIHEKDFTVKEMQLNEDRPIIPAFQKCVGIMEGWTEMYTATEIKDILQDTNYIVLAVLENQTVVGGLIAWRGNGYIFIDHIRIDERFRRRSYAKASIKELINKEPNTKLRLRCEKENIDALAFYESLWFRQTQDLSWGFIEMQMD